ncbi:MAG: hypothetical protein GY855_09920 [candidate division Zixibacteria bacterium]|nr:hypothetical protein [candidate division Zixibacteria bacterium]
MNNVNKINEWDLRLVFPGGSNAPETEIFLHAISHTGSGEMKEDALVHKLAPENIPKSHKKNERLSGVE